MNVQVVSDQKLLNCYLSGDRNAISQLIERHSRRVRDYIQMMVKDGDVADDIFQETFIKAVRVIDEGRYTDNGRRPPHGGAAARRAARGGDDALLFGPKFQGDRRTDRCQHQHGAGAYAVRADQSSENDQGKKPDFKLEEAQ